MHTKDSVKLTVITITKLCLNQYKIQLYNDESKKRSKIFKIRTL